MTREEILAYVHRDWRAVEELQARDWAERKRSEGVGAAFRAAEALREDMLSFRPGWPSASDRENDLETHRRVSAALKRVVAADPR